jgi:hypothetical protein
MRMHHHPGPGNGRVARERLSGMRALRRLKGMTGRKRREQLGRGLGLETAPSLQDRTVLLFTKISRG